MDSQLNYGNPRPNTIIDYSKTKPKNLVSEISIERHIKYYNKSNRM